MAFDELYEKTRKVSEQGGEEGKEGEGVVTHKGKKYLSYTLYYPDRKSEILSQLRDMGVRSLSDPRYPEGILVPVEDQAKAKKYFGESKVGLGAKKPVREQGSKGIPDSEDLTHIGKIQTEEDLRNWVKNTGRKSIEDFEEETGVDKSTLIGLWSQVFDERKPEGEVKSIGKKHVFAIAFSRVFDENPEVYEDEKGNFFTRTDVFA